MKKTFIIYFGFIIGSSWAQKSAVTNALIYLQEGQTDKARTEIDKAAVDERTKTDPKTWFHRGEIYSTLIKAGTKDSIIASEAAFSLEQSINLEKAIADNKGKFTKKSQTMMLEIWPFVINYGGESYQARDYYTALSFYKSAQRVNSTDTTAYLYGAYSAEMIRNQSEIVRNWLAYKQLGGKSAQMYLSLLNVYKQQKNTEKANELLKEALAKYPNDAVFKREELNNSLKTGSSADAKKKLLDNLAINPNDVLTLFNLGVIADKELDFDSSIKYYKKVTEIKPAEFDASYNLAINYYKKAMALIVKKNNLSPAEYDKQSKIIETEIKGFLAQSGALFDSIKVHYPDDKQIQQVTEDIKKRIK